MIVSNFNYNFPLIANAAVSLAVILCMYVYVHSTYMHSSKVTENRLLILLVSLMCDSYYSYVGPVSTVCNYRVRIMFRSPQAHVFYSPEKHDRD
jgi:hypothetical protein